MSIDVDDYVAYSVGLTPRGGAHRSRPRAQQRLEARSQLQPSNGRNEHGVCARFQTPRDKLFSTRFADGEQRNVGQMVESPTEIYAAALVDPDRNAGGEDVPEPIGGCLEITRLANNEARLSNQLAQAAHRRTGSVDN
jgi:hypothetical protein